jgi:hypothetical protein
MIEARQDLTTPGVSHPCVQIQPRITSRRYRTLRPAKSSRRSGPTFDMFSDATTTVRRWLWVEWVFAIPAHRGAFSKLSGSFKEILLGRLAPAA